jgi:quercetin dioxygenase-like cupin family protein
MLIRKAQDVPAKPMDMPGARGVTMRLMVGRDDGAPTFAMRLFEVAPGGHTPRPPHNYEHEVMILAGRGQVVSGTGGNTIRPVAAGDVVFMPANEEHQFRNVGEQPLQFLCMVPTQFDCGSGACAATPLAQAPARRWDASGGRWRRSRLSVVRGFGRSVDARA